MMNTTYSLKGTGQDRGLRRAILPFILSGLLLTIGCDLNVFNPGSVEDDDLNDPAAISALVMGAEGDFAFATTGERPGGVFSAGGFLTDEIVHSGQYVGIRNWSYGTPVDTDSETEQRWALASRARWVAEDAIRRISTLVEDPSRDLNVARVHLWAGFANRMMGDHFCEAVVNGGPLEPSRVFHERAEGFFTDAISIAGAGGDTELRTAAYAGRAQTRMMLGDWVGAVADAGQVPVSFVFEQRHSENSPREYNGLHELHLRDTQASAWGTPFAQWGTEVSGVGVFEGDPRVMYQQTGKNGGDQRRPQWNLLKYPTRNDNVALAKGTEMRLLEGEALVLNGNVGGVVSKINEVRGFRSLSPVSANTVAEAWELLMKERGIELWLEGRRLPDLRRWAVNPGWVPFSVVRAEGPGAASTDVPTPVLEVPMLCLPVGANEKLSNKNIR